MTTGSRLQFGVLGFVLAVTLAYASEEGGLWKLNDTMKYTTGSGLLDGEGNEEDLTQIVELVRGPLVAGTVNVTAMIKTAESLEASYGTLLGVRILVADDDNENGAIEASEKVTVASATAGPLVNGWRTAQTGSVTISVSHDWYQLVGDYRAPDDEEFEYTNTILFHGVTDPDLAESIPE